MSGPLKPPPALDQCRVLQYAILDASATYSGHSDLYVGDKEVGPVPRLAICQEGKGDEVLLLHCDDSWESLGATAYSTIEEARAKAERIYPGVSKLWIDANVSEEQAAAYLDEYWSSHRCSFCGRDPRQFEKVIEKNNVRICGSCVKDAYDMMREDQSK